MMFRVMATTATGASVYLSAPAWVGAMVVVTTGVVVTKMVLSKDKA